MIGPVDDAAAGEKQDDISSRPDKLGGDAGETSLDGVSSAEVAPASNAQPVVSPGEDAEPEPIEDEDEAPRASEIIAQVRGILGVSTGDIRMSGGQNATGAGAAAIGAVNLFNSDPEDGVWLERLSRTHVERRLATYAPTPSDGDLEQAVKSQRIVWLVGRPETGRVASAIVALARQHDAEVAVLSVDRLDRLLRRNSTLTRRRGYLLDLSDGPSDVSERVVSGLAARADRLESTFLFVSASSAVALRPGREVTHKPPAGADVVRAHLSHAVQHVCRPTTQPCLERCVDRYVEQDLLRHPDLVAFLRSQPPLAEIVGLTGDIAAATPRGEALTALLRARLPDQLRRRASAILDGSRLETALDPDYLRAFRLSCAVLNGFPRKDIEQAAQRLLGPAAVPAGGSPIQRPSVDRLFGDDRAVLEVGSGWAGGRVVRFADSHESLRGAILTVAWSEWNAADRLLSWLCDLVQEAPPTRHAVAQVIGWSANQDRQAALDAVLALARDKRNSVRQAAAVAVVAMAMQPSLRSWLRRQVSAWAETENAFLRDTVARAYLLGLRDIWPESALAHLELVARYRMQVAYQAVARVVEEHYRAGYAHQVVSAMVRWCDDDRVGLRVQGARAVGRLIALPAPPPRDHWPDLLDQARTGTIDPEHVAKLWSVALSLPSTAFRSWRWLGDWVDRCAGQPDAARALLALLTRLCERPPLRRRLAHHVRYLWPREMPENVLLPELARLVK